MFILYTIRLKITIALISSPYVTIAIKDNENANINAIEIHSIATFLNFYF